MRVLSALVASLIVLTGCTVADGFTVVPLSEAQSATYSLTYDRVYGDCPERLAQQVTLAVTDDDATLTGPCTGTGHVTRTEASWEATCNGTRARVHVEMNDVWTSGSGMASLEQEHCSGLYSVAVSKSR